MEVIITDHANKRVKERVGLPKKAIKKYAQAAFDKGIRHSSAKGRLKRWLDSLYLERKKANNLRVLGRHVYVFNNNALITVLHLPHRMEGALSKSL
jgi:hypothetical protein